MYSNINILQLEGGGIFDILTLPFFIVTLLGDFVVTDPYCTVVQYTMKWSYLRHIEFVFIVSVQCLSFGWKLSNDLPLSIKL